MRSELISNTFRVDAGGRAMDPYHWNWERSAGEFDIPHNFKFGHICDLPCGKGQKWNLGGVGNAIAGGCHMSAIHVYAGGQPVQLTGGGISLTG